MPGHETRIVCGVGPSGTPVAFSVGADGALDVSQSALLTYGAIQTRSMGNAGPTIIVPGNNARRGLIITNISDTVGFLCIGSAAGLTTTTYTLRLAPTETLVFSEPLSAQTIHAVCGAADKEVAYQEAT